MSKQGFCKDNKKKNTNPIKPHEADRTASLILASLDNRSKNANILFRCGVMMERSTRKK